MAEKWDRPASPPPPLFLGEKERDYAKQVNDEISERVVGQTILYYPIDLNTTDFHPLYGESLTKTFFPPVRVYALVEWQGQQTQTQTYGIDTVSKIKVNFHKKRVSEDQDLYVREGDFILYAEQYFEIVNLNKPTLLFGQQEHKFEISAECISARQGIFPEYDLD